MRDFMQFSSLVDGTSNNSPWQAVAVAGAVPRARSTKRRGSGNASIPLGLMAAADCAGLNLLGRLPHSGHSVRPYVHVSDIGSAPACEPRIIVRRLQTPRVRSAGFLRPPP